jgi:hypothetical protein
VAVILASEARAHRHRIYDLAFDVGLAHGVDVAPLVLDEARLTTCAGGELRLAATLDSESIRL